MISMKPFFSGFYVEVKSRTNNYHLIHKENCPFLPEKENRICLGVNAGAHDAISEAKGYFNKCECCRFCMKDEQIDRKKMIFDEIINAKEFPVSSIIQPIHEEVMGSYAS